MSDQITFETLDSTADLTFVGQGRRTRSSKYDPLLKALIALDDGQAIMVPVPFNAESELSKEEQAERFNNRIAQVMQLRLKGNPAIEGYKYRKRLLGDLSGIVIMCKAIEEDEETPATEPDDEVDFDQDEY